MPDDDRELLLHVCCAPCLSKSLAGWRRELGLPDDAPHGPPAPPGRGVFFNPNIHPLIEFRRRAKAVHVYAQRDAFPVDVDDAYGLDRFLDDCRSPAPFPDGYEDPDDGETIVPAGNVGTGSETGDAAVSPWSRPRRCARCFARRLDRVAARAKAEGYRSFGTTLAASHHQDRDLLEAIGRAAARRWGVPFLWRDWREAEPPVRLVKGLYKQSYCGCVFSERDRYENTKLHLVRDEEGGRRN